MPNIKQQKKRVLTNEKARQRNAHFKSRVRTQVKKVRLAVESKDKALAEKEFRAAVSLLDKAQGRGIIHKNKVARHKADLTHLVNTLK